MLQDNLRALGSLEIALIDQYGNLKSKEVVPNQVVNSGFAFITSRMIQATDNVMSHMAVGTNSGDGAVSGADTALTSQLGSRVALTSSSRVLTTVANDSVQFQATFDPGVATGAIKEAGIFNALTGGTMLCRTVFNVVNKDAGDTLTITWKVVVSQNP